MNAHNIWDGILPKDKEERDQELEREVKRIKYEKQEERKQRRKTFSGKELHRHTNVLKQLVIFAIYYLLGNVIIVLMQLNISESYEQTVVKKYLKNKKGTLDFKDYNISNTEFKKEFHLEFDKLEDTIQIFQWVDQVLIPVVYSNDTFKILEQNYVFNKPYIRVTVQKKDYENSFGESVITDDLDVNGQLVKYTKPDSHDSPFMLGGYVLGYSDTQAAAITDGYLKNKNYLSKNWSMCILEFLYFNRNSDTIVDNLIVFRKSPSGLVETSSYSYTIRDHYLTPLDRFRGFLEFVYLFFFCFYLYTTLKGITFIYIDIAQKFYGDNNVESEEDSREQRETDNIRRKTKLNFANYLGIKFVEGWSSKAIVVAVFYLIYIFLKAIMLVIYWIIASVRRYCQEKAVRVLKLLSVILGLIIIARWIQIVTEEKVEINSDRTAKDAYESLYSTVFTLELYKRLVSVHTILSLYMTKYGSFSANLSMFYEVLKKGMVDIIFFFCIFLVYLFIFALVAHIIFGISDEKFITFKESVYITFMIMIGNNSPFEVETTLILFRTIYGFFCVLAAIVLINMLVAIILAHYIEYYIDTIGDDLGIIKVIKEAFAGDYEELEKKKLKWYHVREKAKVILIRIVNYMTQEDEVLQTSKDNIKQFEEVKREPNLLLASKDIVTMILESEGNLLPEDFRQQNYAEILEHMKNSYFWIELIDSTLVRLSGRSIYDNTSDSFLLNNDPRAMFHIVLEHNLLREQQKESEYLDDELIRFMMYNPSKQLDDWSKKFIKPSNYSKAFLIWNALGELSAEENIPESNNTQRHNSASLLYSSERDSSCEDRKDAKGDSSSEENSVKKETPSEQYSSMPSIEDGQVDEELDMQHEFELARHTVHSYEPKLTQTQVNLWTDIYSKDDKTRASRFWATMWFDEFETSTGFRGLTYIQKVAIWNSVKLPYTYLLTVSHNKWSKKRIKNLSKLFLISQENEPNEEDKEIIEKEKKKDQRPDSLDSDSSEFIEEESKRKK